jgi:ABC-type cobalamin/Fe3+-siderophores transport system ATPase subunit
MLMANGQVKVAGSATEVLTEENILTHYGAKVRILNDFGRPIVVPTDFLI